MDKSKLGVALGIFGFLVLVLWGVVAITGRQDPTQVAMNNSLIAQETVIEISTIASRRAANQETQTLATSILNTTTSDRNRLAEIYSNSFGSPPADPDNAAVEEVEEAGEGFDRTYRSTVSEYLSYSLDHLQAVRQRSGSEEVAAIVDVMIANHERHLEQLDN